MSDYYKQSIKLHQKLKGKLEISSKVLVENKEDLAAAYTLAACVKYPTFDKITHSSFEKGVADKGANAVKNATTIISNHKHNRI